MSLNTSTDAYKERFKTWLLKKTLPEPSQVIRHLYSLPRLMGVDFDFFPLSLSSLKQLQGKVIASSSFKGMSSDEKLGVIHALRLFGQFCTDMESPDAENNSSISGIEFSVENERSAIPRSSLEYLLQDQRYQPLLEALKSDGVTTVEQAVSVPLLVYLNKKNLYAYVKRSSIVNDVKGILQETLSSNSNLPLHSDQAASEDAHSRDTSCLKLAELRFAETYTDVEPELCVISGKKIPVVSWTDILPALCTVLVQKYPERIEALVDTPLDQRERPLISRWKRRFAYAKEFGKGFFVNAQLDARRVLSSARKICVYCGVSANDFQVYVRPKESFGIRLNCSKSAPERPEFEEVFLPCCTPTFSMQQKVEDFVKSTGLRGVSLEDVCSSLKIAQAVASDMIGIDNTMVEMGRNRYIHRESIVDADEIANAMLQVLLRYFERFEGYVSARLFYNMVRVDLAIPLNDNGFDDIASVYSLAKHFFSKERFAGHSFVFHNGVHIWQKEPDYPKNMKGLAVHHARMTNGLVSIEECAAFFESLGLDAPNLKQTIGIGKEATFFQYDRDLFLLAETLSIDEQWKTCIFECLECLFDQNEFAVIRDIRREWYSGLPDLPFGLQWTPLLLQDVLQFYQEIGYRTIPALLGQRTDTLHAAIVPLKSDILTFADFVAALLQERNISRKHVDAEEFRRLLKENGVLDGNELLGNMHKVLDDARFAWSSDRRMVLLNAGV